jgi:ABC-type cobalamin/Fe3+-siderophores transport system ATPase subunit
VENKEAKYIDKVEIKGLFGRYDVDWTLNPDVNILVGENGTGKSTILKGIQRINLSNKAKVSFPYKFVDNNKISFSKMILRHKLSVDNDTITLEQFAFDEAHKTQEYSINSYLTYLDEIPTIYFIQTFDNYLPKKDETNKDYIKTTLDVELDKQILNYMFYENKKFKNDSNRNKSLNEVLRNSYLFLKIANRLFKTTEKELILSDNNNGTTDSIFNIKFKNGDIISCFDLSSGEKQLLIILLTVLCQDEKPSILLMDEPEISLDVSWQFELLSTIRELNPNCQLIIVTHSPAIYAKGWRDKVFFMDDIIPQLKKQTV